MKKIFALLLSTMMICTAFAFSGCEKDPEPYFRMYNNDSEMETVASFHPKLVDELRLEYSDSYGEFLAYYNSELFPNVFPSYILDPKFKMTNMGPSIHQERDFYIYRDKAEQNEDEFRYVFRECIEIYDSGYFQVPDSDYSGVLYSTINMEYYTAPVADSVNGSDYILEFGESEKAYDLYRGVYKKYVNIYIDKTCVGTCYYYEHVPISVEWFENYFKENLIGR